MKQIHAEIAGPSVKDTPITDGTPIFFDEYGGLDTERTFGERIDVVEWDRRYAFCGKCWHRTLLWVKGNVGYCDECRPDWRPDE